MQKAKFLKLTVTMVIFGAIAAAVLLFLVPDYLSEPPFGWNLTYEVLLIAYAAGALLGDLLCGKDDSWIISSMSVYYKSVKEVDREYGSDEQMARRNAPDYKTYLIIRLIGSFFKLLTRLLFLAPSVIAVIASWLVRVIVSLVVWIKEAKAAGVSGKSIALKFALVAGVVLLVAGALFAGLQLGRGQLGREAGGGILAPRATQTPNPIVSAAPTTRPSEVPADITAPPSADVVTAAPVNTATEAPTEQATDSPAPTEEPGPGFDTAGLDFVPEERDCFDEPRELLVIAQSRANVRTGPGTDYTQLDTLYFTDRRNAVAAANDWFLVEYAPGRYGWISGKLTIALWMFEDGLNGNLGGLDAPDRLLNEPELKNITSSNGANLRTGSSTSKKKLYNIKYGVEFALIARDGGWCFINYSGAFGWIHEDGFAVLELLDSGSYHYVLKSEGGILELDGEFLVSVNIVQEHRFTKEQLEKACAGETVTAHGYTIPSDIRPTVEADELDSSCEYISEQAQFWLDSDTGDYLVYPPYEGLPLCYNDTVAQFYINSRTDVIDYNNPVYVYDSLSDADKQRFGVQFNDGDPVAKFSGDNFMDYVELICEYWNTDGIEFEGSVTIKNGVATHMVAWYYP